MARVLSAVGVIVAALVATLALGYDNGRGARPPMGWNTWCTYDVCGLIDKCSDAEVRREASALVLSGMVNLGYEYVLMDDCWNDKTRDPVTGALRPNPERFPYGMKALADYVHSLGLKIGLYTCVGTKTCKNDLPGSFGHYEQDAKTFAEWGIDFVKADNCAKPRQYTELELYSNFSRALNSTGRPILFSLCEWGVADVQTWGGKVGQMFRIQMDHLPLYNFPLHTAAGMGFGQGVKNIIQYVATLRPSTFVRQFGWMDPDFLMTDFWPTMTTRYSRVEISLWAAWSAPLIVATQVSNMTDAKRELLLNPEVVAIDQDPSNTAADMVKNVSEAVQLWARPLANGDAAAIIVNLNDYLWHQPGQNVTVTWGDFGVTGNVTAARDLWAQAPVDPAKLNGATYSDYVDASDVRFFRLTCSPAPCM